MNPGPQRNGVQSHRIDTLQRSLRFAERSSRDKPMSKTKFSLCHPVEHRRGDPVLHWLALKESFQIVEYYVRNLLAHLASTAGDVRSHDCSLHVSQRMADGERFQRIRDVDGAAKPATAD